MLAIGNRNLHPCRMLRRLWPWIGLGFLSVGCRQVPPLERGQVFVPISQAEVRLIGRWGEQEPGQPEASWPGFAVSIDFTGRDLSICLKDSGNYYNVRIDGKQAGDVPQIVKTGGSGLG